jgi:hypothetical protein
MSNSYFTGVSNEEIPNRIFASSADIGTINAQTINAQTIKTDRLDFPGDYPINNIIYLTGSGAASIAIPSNDIILNISNKGLLFISSQNLTATGNINFGSDTSARAAELLSLFNISNNVPSRLIKVSTLFRSPQAIGISNTAGGANYVQFKLLLNDMTITNESSSITIVDANGASDGYILVSKGTPPTSSESAILFLVLGKVN